MQTLTKAISAGAIIGAGLAAVMVWIAVNHNPQQAYYDVSTDRMDYQALALVWLSWFIPVALITSVLSFAAINAWNRLRKPDSGQ